MLLLLMLLLLPQYHVYRGDSEELLYRNIEERASVFCSGFGFLGDGRRCTFQMSPFWPTYVAIKDGQGWQPQTCVMTHGTGAWQRKGPALCAHAHTQTAC